MELQDVTKSSTAVSIIDIAPILDKPLMHVDENAQSEANEAETDGLVHQVLELKPTPIGFVLSFSNLKYSVSQRSNYSNKKVLLNDISDEAREGKSTLIDALANRISKGSLQGSVTLNGEVLESKTLKMISAYVMQDDLLFPMLTVEETLLFSAEFRLPRSISKSKKLERVRALIDQLGLQNAANTLIGDEGHRGISGGERRRVSIGVDIIHDPILLFLDEPTSGLDSTSAFMVVKVLQQIARSGSIVVMSVHQPSYRILSLFDHLIFLSRGQTVYNGSPKNLSLFFSEFGHPIPENENPTEFFLDFIRELEVSPGGTKRLVDFNKSSWQDFMSPRDSNSKGILERQSLKDSISSSISRGKLVFVASNNDATPTSIIPTFTNPIWFEIYVLSKRSMKNSSRMPKLLLVRLATVLVTGFMLATIFWQLDNSPEGVQERLGVLVFAVSTTFYNSVQALPEFLQERYIFIRETAYNAYRCSSYVVSNSILTIPALIIFSIAFAAPTFWAVGLSGGFSGFFFFFIAILASFWVGSSFVTFLSGVVPNVLLGYVICVAMLAYFLLLGGFFINQDRIPPYWIWFHYISLIKYPFEGVLLNEFDDPSKCLVRGVQAFDRTPVLELLSTDEKVKLLKTLSKSFGVNITPNTCVSTGVDILRKLGINGISKWSSIWITLAWGFLFRIIFYFCLLFGSKNKRT
ncbi:hypothetical protein MKW92_035873 [Papaver armeniacum]|nr:hypothetical protein MKW92_035873 [Papaver armeniacum]